MIDIIIPTYANLPYLVPCVRSIRRWTQHRGYRIIIVNNGEEHECDGLRDQGVAVYDAGANRGWLGGLELGLSKGTGCKVLFLNDDTLIVPSSPDWLARLELDVSAAGVGAAGPASACVSGGQSIGWIDGPDRFVAHYLIGFCMLVDREALAKAGGLDHGLPGGDDIDLSIRLQDAGYSLIADRTVYVHHFGFKTGERVYGPRQQPGGWNSELYINTVADALIAKHGRERLTRMGWVPA